VKYLSQSDNPLLGSNTTALDHDKVIVDLSVMGEASHRSDGLLCWIKLGGSIVFDQLTIFGMHTLSDTVDLLIDLSSMVITFLTSSGNSELDTTRMPGSNTGHLT